MCFRQKTCVSRRRDLQQGFSWISSKMLAKALFVLYKYTTSFRLQFIQLSDVDVEFGFT